MVSPEARLVRRGLMSFGKGARMKHGMILGIGVALGLAVSGGAAVRIYSPEGAAAEVGEAQEGAAQRIAAPPQPAVERARKSVRMLDDVYKTTIVLITDKYVRDKKDYPAGRAAIKLFQDISAKGWHEVRLIDVSGEPYNPNNVAKDEFDKDGVRAMKDGKSFFDRMVVKDRKHYLRAMTPVPVVMDKCILCHENYRSAKKGEAIGALTYSVPIE
jgi:hypothetical protein